MSNKEVKAYLKQAEKLLREAWIQHETGLLIYGACMVHELDGECPVCIALHEGEG